LVKSDEISSTEKLLDLIRNRGKAVDPPSDAAASSEQETPTPKKQRTRKFKSAPKRTRRKTPSKTPVTIGVDIRTNSLRLASSVRGADGFHTLLNFQNAAYDGPINIESAEFTKFLSQTLSAFTAAHRKHEIWVSMPSANVEMRLLKLPKIPERQLPNAAKWAFRREATLDETRDIFDFHPLALTFDEGLQKIPLLAYTVPRDEVKRLQTAFSKSGYPLTGVSIVPFGIQNLLKAEWMETDGKNICSLFVGKDWSRIAIYADGNLMLGRDIKAGVHSIIGAISENLHPQAMDAAASVENLLMPAMADNTRASEPTAEQVLLAFLRDQLPHDPQQGQPLSAAKVSEIIAAPLERIIRQVAMTIEHYTSNFDPSGIGKILISGDIAGHPWIAHRIARHLDLPTEVMDPFARQPTRGPGSPIPETIFGRMAYLPSFGNDALRQYRHPEFFVHTRTEKQIENDAAVQSHRLFGIRSFVCHSRRRVRLADEGGDHGKKRSPSHAKGVGSLFTQA
jgi:Tfp pilus assembly PilM family ATPase